MGSETLVEGIRNFFQGSQERLPEELTFDLILKDEKQLPDEGKKERGMRQANG